MDPSVIYAENYKETEMKLFLRVLASYAIWRFLWAQLSWLIFTLLLMTPSILLCLWVGKGLFGTFVFLCSLLWGAMLLLLWGTILVCEDVMTYTAWVLIREIYTEIADDYQRRKEAIITSDLKSKKDAEEQQHV